ncbi:MAG TPA: hypothetical protein VHS09_11895 [Polyangiaceae bacterium]|nr:hypothetical protein [Polyangiaceae bacterium]
MKRLPLLVAALAAAVLTASAARDAHALGPIDLEVAAKVGAGTNLSNGGPINPLGLGLGGRAGVAFFGFYGGVDVVDYLGGSQTLNPAGSAGASGTKESAHALMYGLDLGYNLKVAVLTLRPLLGLGNFELSTSPGSTNPSYFYLQPGLTALVSLGLVFVGADANLLVLPSVGTPTGNQVDTAFTVHGQIGLRF